MTSVRRRQRSQSLSDDFEEANGINTDPVPEPEDLDWDGYSSTLEHRLAAVGNRINIQPDL